jgi:hypothetical protein
MRLDSEANLDMLSRLQDFSFDFWSRDYRMRVKGVRRKGNTFRISMKTGESLRSSDVEIPDDVVVYSPMVQMALTKLRPGQTYSLKTMDPLTMDPTTVSIKAIRREPLALGTNRWDDATVLEIRDRDIVIQTWIDSAGRVLRQETPFGWTLEYCSFDEAMSALRDAGGTDFASEMAVQVRGRFRDPENALWLRLGLCGTDMSGWVFPSPRVTVEQSSPTCTVVRVAAGRSGDMAAERPEGLDGYLQPTRFVQSDDRLIRAQAAKIVGTSVDPSEKAERIFKWVHENVSKDTALTVPSALDVLKTMRGDCNEHTVLFAALARAAGLPSKMLAGVVFKEGSFYYHAWPAVWSGGWVEMDPTWGQRHVDASHLPLVEGELADQMSLVRVMGRLKLDALGEGDRER